MEMYEDTECIGDESPGNPRLLNRFMWEDWDYYQHIKTPRRINPYTGKVTHLYKIRRLCFEAKIRISGAWQVLRGNARARPLRLDGI